MMKRTVLLFLALISVFALVACSGGAPAGIHLIDYVADYKGADVYGDAEMTEYEGYVLDKNAYNVLFSQSNGYKVVFSTEGEELVSVSDYGESSVTLYGNGTFSVRDSMGECALYDDAGVKIYSFDTETDVTEMGKVLTVGKELFCREPDGTLSRATLSEYFEVGEFDYYVDGKFYYIEDSSISVYNTDGALIYYYSSVSAYADEGRMAAFPLENGDLLITEVYRVESDAEYTFVTEGEYFKIREGIANPERGTYKSLPDTRLYVSVVNVNTLGKSYDSIIKKGENFVTFLDVVDGYLKSNEADVGYALVDNEGVTVAELSKAVYAQRSIPFNIAKDRYVAGNINGEEFLIKSDGTVVSRLPSGYKTAGEVILADGKLYNMDMVEVFDFEEEGYTYYDKTASNFFFSNVDEIFVYKNGEMVSVADSYTERTVIFDSYYYIYDDYDEIYRYYNVSGTEVLTTQVIAQVLVEGEDGSLVLFDGVIGGAGRLYFLK